MPVGIEAMMILIHVFHVDFFSFSLFFGENGQSLSQ